MPDTSKTNAENKANAQEIERVDATEETARGNVHSEADQPVDQDAPPPMPT